MISPIAVMAIGINLLGKVEMISMICRIISSLCGSITESQSMIFSHHDDDEDLHPIYYHSYHSTAPHPLSSKHPMIRSMLVMFFLSILLISSQHLSSSLALSSSPLHWHPYQAACYAGMPLFSSIADAPPSPDPQHSILPQNPQVLLVSNAINHSCCFFSILFLFFLLVLGHIKLSIILLHHTIAPPFHSSAC